MKPICFLDTETTGVNTKESRIVEIGIVKLMGSLESTYHAVINPECDIPLEASEVHGITNEDVKDEPTFKVLAQEILDFIGDGDLGGFNSNMFDIPLLYYEFRRAGIEWDLKYRRFIDVSVIYKRKEERTLSAAVQFYLGKEHSDAHGAVEDTQATVEVFKQMLIDYPDLQKLKMNEWDTYCNYDKERVDLEGKFYIDEDGDYCFNFGSYKGKKAKENTGMLHWMIEKDFLPDAKEICYEILNKPFPR